MEVCWEVCLEVCLEVVTAVVATRVTAAAAADAVEREQTVEKRFGISLSEPPEPILEGFSARFLEGGGVMRDRERPFLGLGSA